MQTIIKKGAQKAPKVGKNLKSRKIVYNQSSVTAEAEVEKTAPVKKDVMDGNSIAAYVAYGFSENCFIYPISPSSAMGDKMDQMASSGTKNIFGQVVDCLQMQSEGGAAGAMHGAIASGALTSTFTASQGLLLMIPNMYLMAGERAPTVIHVASRTISKHALSIFNDHSDVMACRQTGFALLCSSRNQEVHDMAMVSHIATLKTGIPFLHFFDGWQTSHNYSNIELMPYSEMRKLFPDDYLKSNLRDKQMTTINPLSRGLGQRPDIFFQQNMANKKYYDNAPDLIQEVMNDLAKVTGRELSLFKFYGHQEATDIIVIMGSAANSCREVLQYYRFNHPDRKVGIVKVCLYRPWSPKHFLEQLPSTTERITILDKTREEGSQGEPLYLDVVSSISESENFNHVKCYSGIYGLASKNFTPNMIASVFNNMQIEKPRHKFTIGINDDVTHTSLEITELEKPTLPASIRQCINWGFGGDGSVGAMNSTVKLISEQTGQQVQLQTSYDSKKEGGATVSHLRYGKDKITAEYLITENADFITCTKEAFIRKFDMIKALKKGGTFLQNTSCTTAKEVEDFFPAKMLRDLANKETHFYVIDAQRVAKQAGMAKRTNTVMQASFLKLSQVLPGDESIDLLKNDIKKRFKLKGQDIIDKNLNMLEHTMSNIIKIDIPEHWKTIQEKEQTIDPSKQEPDFIKNIMRPVLALQGDDLPVSTFEAGGLFPQDTAQYEKRGIANEIPIWKASKCTQCNYCSLVCPHAVIRPFLLTRAEKKEAPQGYQTLKATGGNELAGFEYTIQVSSKDCTGCAVCVESCPDDALEMVEAHTIFKQGTEHWDYSTTLPIREEVINPFTVKGSQFLRPYFEFSGACSGCGETPYMKLVSQLFGKRMIIANASGCSSVWGGTATTSPWVVDEKNRGPAWARSLFEDNAEYGLGMFKASEKRKERLAENFQKALDTLPQLPEELRTAFSTWLENQENVEKCDNVYNTVTKFFEGELRDQVRSTPLLRDINADKKNIVKESHWIVGGDGWAYDIGFGGLDHILAKGKNVNVLIFDTEMYSNTGGQASKATELSTSIKFSILGKRDLKKDLGVMAMTYGNVYVASIAMGANYNQALQAIKEAEEYPGTSIVLCLSPCIDWGFGDMKQMMDMQKDAVDSGYWTLYRYDPRIDTPLTLDSKKLRKDLMSYLGRQQRFQKLVRLNENLATGLHQKLQDILIQKHERVLRQSMNDMDLLEYLKKQIGEQITGEKAQLILYGSETGTAENLAKSFADDLKSRGVKAKCMAMDDYDIEELPEEEMVYFIVSTCGSGELPQNCKYFTKQLLETDMDLSNVKFSVFGLGDKSYEEFNESAITIDDRLGELGGQRILERGLGDDKDDEKYETAWYEWQPQIEDINELPPQPDVVPEPKYAVNIVKDSKVVPYERFMPTGTKKVNLNVNERMSPADYERDVRHYEFDTKDLGLYYGSGDCFSIFPHNNQEQVTQLLDEIKLNPNDLLQIKKTDNTKMNELPEQASTHQVFTEVLDIFGRPSRRFYEFLSKYAKDEKEKDQIKFILSKEGQSKMKELISETTTYADLLKMFPSAMPSIEYLVQHIAPIKPRLYSIASHPDFVGDQIHLCVIADDWNTPSGKYQQGLCSNYLRTLEPKSETGLVTAKLYPSSITIHEDQTPPIFMVALGTGIAPMRALVQERYAAKLRGEKVGPMTLLFGSRNKKNDWLYEAEWQKYQDEGILQNVITAFSRDQKQKIYVQHRIDEHPDLIFDYLYKNNGYFYLCGIGGPEESVKVSIRKAIQDGAKLTDEQADAYMKRLAAEGRFNFETW